MDAAWNGLQEMMESKTRLITLTPVMVKLFLQCPRQLWLAQHTWFKPLTPSMLHGRRVHERVPWSQVASRIGASEVKVNLYLESRKHPLHGILDAAAKIGEEWRPLEYKHQTLIGRAEKTQVTLYAILLEENTGIPVTRAYIITPAKIYHVKTTGALKQRALQTLYQALQAIAKTIPPPPRPSPLCKTCPYKNQCYL